MSDAAKVAGPVPPLLRVEQYACFQCGGWVDPKDVIHTPFHAGTTPARLLFTPCDHCGGGFLFSLRWDMGVWHHDMTPLHVPADKAAVVVNQLACTAPDLAEHAVLMFLKGQKGGGRG